MKNLNNKKTMIFGIGNSARQDDGLAWAFLDEVSKQNKFKGELHYRYQLNIEDAETVSNAEKVIFVDAFAGKQNESCVFEKCKPNGEITYTTHALNPEAIIALCNDVYGVNPEAYVLKIKGKEWELGEGLTLVGKHNLNDAINLVSKYI
jgi:hydrogenase maturation protease